MSVAYDPKSFIHEGAYPPLGDDRDNDTESDHQERLTDNDVAEQLQRYTNEVMGADLLGETISIDPPEFVPPPVVEQLPSDTASASPQPDARKVVRPPKPDRQVTKKADGKYHCSREDCQEPVKAFLRRCEWSKHMDKHERPYVCTETGCEGLPGFTYSGGLLRHEREVHQKHGGPRKTTVCPHSSCKRHDSGKGFSRLENLNEHLRRCHTAGRAPSPDPPSPESTSGKRKRSLFDLLDDEEYERQLRQQARRADVEAETEEPGGGGGVAETTARDTYRRAHREIVDAVREMREVQSRLAEGLREAGLEALVDDLEKMASRTPLTAEI